MADNTTLPGTGEVVRDKDRAGVKTQIIGIDLAPGGAETLMNGAMPVTDNGGSLTVDGTVAVSGTVAVTDNSGSLTVDGTVTANAGTGPWPVTDNAGSLTVDAPVGTPLYVRLSDGSTAIATLPVSLASLPALAAGTNNIGDVDVLTLPSLPAGNNNIGDVDIASALPAGTNAIGKLAANSGVDIGDVDVTSLPAIPAGSNLIGQITLTPGTAGGWTPQMYAAQTTTLRAVKASAGTFGGYYAYNPNGSVAYIQVFNVASGSVTLGTTTPTMIFAIPAGSAANLEFANGIAMGTAITLACTTTATGNSAPSTGLDLTVLYK